MKLDGRQVEMFRCHLDPMIGPKPQQAFMPKDMHAQAIITAIGIYFKFDEDRHGGTEHIIPYANVQSVRLVKGEK